MKRYDKLGYYYQEDELSGIEHFVLTRFNIKYKSEFDTDKNDLPTATDEWMEHRMRLFENVCLPSMKAQSNKDFTWLIFFDENTKGAYKERIDSYTKELPNMEPVYMPHVKSDIELATEVNKRLPNATQRLLTTRIDNDDAFAYYALETIRNRAQEMSSDMVLNLRFGISYYNGDVKVKSHKSNPFLSLFELKGVGGEFKSVFCGKTHNRMRDIAPVMQIDDRPYWLVLIHERNVKNEHYKHGIFRTIDKLLFWPKECRKGFNETDIKNIFDIEISNVK